MWFCIILFQKGKGISKVSTTIPPQQVSYKSNNSSFKVNYKMFHYINIIM